MSTDENPRNRRLFAEWQPRYAEHGIATFPVREKRPAVRGYLKLGSATSARLAEKFSDAEAIGFALGKRSKITVLDVDTPDERVLADALDQHGQTPVIVRSGSGNFHAWYRWNREPRKIRSFAEKPVDILGGGFVVAPPSRGTKSNYQFIEGSLDDLDSLPILRDVEIATPPRSPASTPFEVVTEGRRNRMLWEHCMRSARFCDDFDALLDVARTHNQAFVPSLSDDEVSKVARSAWSYTQRGENRFGRPGVFFDAEEANRLIASDQDAFILVAFLRLNNGPESAFMVANKLADKFGWTRKRLAHARRRLEETDIQMVIAPSTYTGPAKYRWRAQRRRRAGGGGSVS